MNLVLRYVAAKIYITYPVCGFDVTRIALLSPTLATYRVLSNPSSDLLSKAATAVAPDATILFFRDCISVIKNELCCMKGMIFMIIRLLLWSK